MLSHGLKFYLPSANGNSEKIFVELEVMMRLFRHTPRSKEQLSSLKARSSDLAHAYSKTLVDLSNVTLHRKFFPTIKFLRTNEDIHITNPDKRLGVVNLNSTNYVQKMEFILKDALKF